MTLSVLEVNSLLQVFSIAIFYICGASLGHSASAELLVIFLVFIPEDLYYLW